MSRIKSISEFKRAQGFIPGGVNSPVRSFQALNIPPLVVEKAKEDLITDVDGNEYIDFCMSWGALILGHSHPIVKRAVLNQIDKGTSYGQLCIQEIELASYLCHLIPPLERVRFVSSGTEATMSAIRLAKGFTGKKQILKFDGNYHGHSDLLLVQAGSYLLDQKQKASSLGVNEEQVKNTLSIPYGDLESLDAFFADQTNTQDLAAVILEPIAGNMGVVAPSKEYLQALRNHTQRCGALLIFDEVISGFRASLLGAYGLYDVQPDLICYGKIIGGGLPCAAFGGSLEIMQQLSPQGGVFQAGTLSGNPLAMSVGLETMKALCEPNFYAELEQKMEFLTPVKEWIQKRDMPICIQSVGSMFTVFFGVKKIQTSKDLVHLDLDTYRKFYHYVFERGIFLSPWQQEACFISSAHTQEHLHYTQKVFLDFLSSL